MPSHTFPHPQRPDPPEVRGAVLHSVALAISCLISYWLITDLLAGVHFLSTADEFLGGMWAVIATLFVYRTSYKGSVGAALSRIAATLLSLALCLVYLALFAFHPVGMAVVIGLGTLVLMLIGHPDEVLTTAIATAVVMVLAALSPHDAWEQPSLRLVDTGVGVAVGFGAASIAQRLGALSLKLGLSSATSRTAPGNGRRTLSPTT